MSPDESARYLLRPCAADDLPALERFAAASPVGITTLPYDRAFLTDRLQRSLHSFATEDASGEEIYLFALEDLATRAVIGISGIAARAGFSDRFYSFRNEFVVHSSKPLGVTTRIHTLHLCHDLTDVSLLISFHIDPAYVDTLAPQLLSRARLLFVAQHAERFADRIAAESAGVPHARVAVHLVSFEDRIPALVAEPLLALREKAGLPPATFKSRSGSHSARSLRTRAWSSATAAQGPCAVRSPQAFRSWSFLWAQISLSMLSALPPGAPGSLLRTPTLKPCAPRFCAY